MIGFMEPGALGGIGDAVSGGLVARQFEPSAGEKPSDRTHETACLNCGTELVGPFCQNCGQAAHVHRSLTAFWHDLAHGVLHFEGKIWRTLPLLFFRPGDLTRRYIEGQRARFVSPMALFLFSVFLMFGVIHAVGGPDFGGGKSDKVESAKSIQKEQQRLRDKVAQLQKVRDQVSKAGRPNPAIDLSIATINSTIPKVGTAEARQAMEDDFVNIDTGGGLGWLDDAYRRAKENPSLLIYKIQSNAYKYSWALIPLSVPFVWLLFFWKRRYKLYDHTVFVTYSLSFMTLMVVVYTLLGLVVRSNDVAVLGITFTPPIHMYRQLRGAYSLSRLSAIWRTFFLVVSAIIVLTIFIMLLVAQGVME